MIDKIVVWYETNLFIKGKIKKIEEYLITWRNQDARLARAFFTFEHLFWKSDTFYLNGTWATIRWKTGWTKNQSDSRILSVVMNDRNSNLLFSKVKIRFSYHQIRQYFFHKMCNKSNHCFIIMDWKVTETYKWVSHW